MRLHVIAGHGAGDPGAGGFGYAEAERVRALANRIKAIGGDSVVLYDTNRNFYKDKGISSLNIPKGEALIEFHQDSSDVSSAKGGHVIIKQGYNSDAYDKNLAAFISGMFPGRSESIVARSNLANVNRAAARGINYRLLECCFISNKDDLDKFNANIDEVAKGILASFGIGANAAAPAPVTPPPAQAPAPSQAPANQGENRVREVQTWLNNTYGAGLAVDGIYGAKTKAALVRALQHELNVQFGKGLSEDGIFGEITYKACVSVKHGAQGNITRVLQGILICLGLTSSEFDGIFGSKTETGVRSLQKSAGFTGKDVDGIAGRNTFRAALG